MVFEAGTAVAVAFHIGQFAAAAAQLGIRPETLNRLLADWQQRGWIAGSRRKWTLSEPEPLVRMAEGRVRPF